jgi:hypothetical protein
MFAGGVLDAIRNSPHPLLKLDTPHARRQYPKHANVVGKKRLGFAPEAWTTPAKDV